MATTSKQLLGGTSVVPTTFDGKLVRRQLESQTIFGANKRKDDKQRIDNATELKRLYREAIPDEVTLLQDLDQDKLKRVADQMYKTFYRPHSGVILNIQINPKLSLNGATSCIKSTNGWAVELSPGAFTKSPAFLGTVLGHELVHVIQCARLNNPTDDMLSMSKPYYWFGELEAATWALNRSSFNRKIGPNPFLHYMTKQERAEFDRTLEFDQDGLGDCLQYILKNSSSEGRKSLEYLRGWIGQDDWTKNVWLKQNHNWEKDFLSRKYEGQMCPKYEDIIDK